MLSTASATEDTRKLGKAPLVPETVGAKPPPRAPADHITAFAELQKQAAQVASGSAASSAATPAAVPPVLVPPVLVPPVLVPPAPSSAAPSQPTPSPPTPSPASGSAKSALAPARAQPDPVLMPLMEFAPVGLFRFSPSGQLTHLNRTLAELLGATQQRELVGASADKLFVRGGEFAQLTDRLEREGVIAEHDTDWRRTDGRTVRVRLRIRKVPATPERAAFLEGAAQDIHPFIRREQELLAEIAYLRKLAVDRSETQWTPTATRLVGGLQKLADALDTARDVVGDMVLALSRLPSEPVVPGNAPPADRTALIAIPSELLQQPPLPALPARGVELAKPAPAKAEPTRVELAKPAPAKAEPAKAAATNPGSQPRLETLKAPVRKPTSSADAAMPSTAGKSSAAANISAANIAGANISAANISAKPSESRAAPANGTASVVASPARPPAASARSPTALGPPIWVDPSEADHVSVADSPSRTVKMTQPTIELDTEAEPVLVGRVDLASMDSSTDALPAAILGPPPGDGTESAGPKAATLALPTLPEPPKGSVLSRTAESKMAAGARAAASAGGVGGASAKPVGSAGATPAGAAAASAELPAKLVSTSDSGDAVRTVSGTNASTVSGTNASSVSVPGASGRPSSSAILPQIPSRSLSSANLPTLPSSGWLDVNELVRSSLPTIRRRIVEALAGRNFQVKLRTKLRATTPVKTNPQDIRDILVQLIGTAVRALSGPAVITLTTATIAKGTLIAVTDDRTTISEGFKTRLFDPTFVTNNERVLVLRACGLAMNRYGGKVGVLSEPNTGTTVTMRFPRPKAME